MHRLLSSAYESSLIFTILTYNKWKWAVNFGFLIERSDKFWKTINLQYWARPISGKLIQANYINTWLWKLIWMSFPEIGLYRHQKIQIFQSIKSVRWLLRQKSAKKVWNQWSDNFSKNRLILTYLMHTFAYPMSHIELKQ